MKDTEHLLYDCVNLKESRGEKAFTVKEMEFIDDVQERYKEEGELRGWQERRLEKIWLKVRHGVIPWEV